MCEEIRANSGSVYKTLVNAYPWSGYKMNNILLVLIFFHINTDTSLITHKKKYRYRTPKL